MDVCVVEGCENLKSSGDLLFCFIHRKRWIEYCKMNSIDNRQIPESTQQDFLDEFMEDETNN